MNGIYNATDDFPFSKLVLLKPTSISGGNYFIKFRLNEMPLYIQTPKCNTKNGILKAGKKYFSDLMFTNEHESFIQWMEKLENYCQKYIYDNKATWFDTELEMHDIENSFSSCFKLYKSGKYYIVRSYVPTQLGSCSLKIYNENEELIDHTEINDKNDIITILEIQGIKCSARSFQIEIEIKQMLVLRQPNLFEKCILSSGHIKGQSSVITTHMYDDNNITSPTNTNTNRVSLRDDIVRTPEIGTSGVVQGLSGDDNPYPNIETSLDKSLLHENDKYLGKSIQSNILKVPLPPSEKNDIIPDAYELKEIDFSLDELSETDQIQIKTRNDVYYKMYQDAKQKAKMAKALALSSYLEAKRIKNTYMLEDLDDSDSDLDEDTITE